MYASVVDMYSQNLHGALGLSLFWKRTDEDFARVWPFCQRSHRTLDDRFNQATEKSLKASSHKSQYNTPHQVLHTKHHPTA